MNKFHENIVALTRKPSYCELKAFLKIEFVSWTHVRLPTLIYLLLEFSCNVHKNYGNQLPF